MSKNSNIIPRNIPCFQTWCDKLSFSSKVKKEFRNELVTFMEEWDKPSAYIKVKTSGSTGVPKEMSLLKEKMILSAQKTCKYFGFDDNTKLFLFLPVHTIAGKMMMIRALCANSYLTVEGPGLELPKQINKTYDFIALTPSQTVVSLKKNPSALKHFKTILIGGGEVSRELEDKLLLLGSNIYHSYGMTETISHIAIRKIGESNRNEFTALENVKLTVKNNGQLEIDADVLEKSILTNDIAEITKEGKVLIKGRVDFVVNSGGVKIHIEELERKLEGLISIPFCYWKENDEVFGEVLIVCLEMKMYSKELLDIFKNNFLKYEIPKKIYYNASIIYTLSHKINREATLLEFQNNGDRIMV